MNSIRKKITNSIYSDYNKLKNNFCIKYFVNKNTVQAIVSFFHLYFIHTAFLICMIETEIKILKMSKILLLTIAAVVQTQEEFFLCADVISLKGWWC